MKWLLRRFGCLLKGHGKTTLVFTSPVTFRKYEQCVCWRCGKTTQAVRIS